jgi:hypothetical protein
MFCETGICAHIIKASQTSINVSAALNCPVRRRCNATVRSNAADDFDEVNNGLNVGNEFGNFCITQLIGIQQTSILGSDLVQSFAEARKGVVYLFLSVIYVLLDVFNIG